MHAAFRAKKDKPCLLPISLLSVTVMRSLLPIITSADAAQNRLQHAVKLCGKSQRATLTFQIRLHYQLGGILSLNQFYLYLSRCKRVECTRDLYRPLLSRCSSKYSEIYYGRVAKIETITLSNRKHSLEVAPTTLAYHKELGQQP